MFNKFEKDGNWVGLVLVEKFDFFENVFDVCIVGWVVKWYFWVRICLNMVENCVIWITFFEFEWRNGKMFLSKKKNEKLFFGGFEGK